MRVGTAVEDETEPYARQIFASVKQRIEQSKLYRLERLSLRDVSEETGLQERDVSRAINTVAHMNFNDFINRYRVEEVKAKLNSNISSDKAGSALDIALVSGFGSKSSFNATFKRLAGMTPSQFVAHLRESGRDNSPDTDILAPTPNLIGVQSLDNGR